MILRVVTNWYPQMKLDEWRTTVRRVCCSPILIADVRSSRQNRGCEFLCQKSNETHHVRLFQISCHVLRRLRDGSQSGAWKPNEIFHPLCLLRKPRLYSGQDVPHQVAPKVNRQHLERGHTPILLELAQNILNLRIHGF